MGGFGFALASGLQDDRAPHLPFEGSCKLSVVTLLPSWEKVARSAG